MKEPKDIFDLFKDNEGELQQRPSHRAWERLESRLDNHNRNAQKPARPRRAPRMIRTWLSMAGVMLVLVMAISVISILFSNEKAKTAMNHKAVPAHFVLEEIGIFSDQNNSREDIDLYRKQLKRLNTNPILEGDPSRELRVKQSFYVEVKNKNEKKSNNTYTNSNPKQIASNGSSKDAIANAESASSVAAYDNSTEPIIKEETPVRASTERIIVSSTAKTEGMTDEETTMMEEIALTSAPVTEADMAYDGLAFQQTDETSIALSDFKWLLGQWKSPIYNNDNTTVSKSKKAQAPASQSRNKEMADADLPAKETTENAYTFEEWEQVDATTFSGIGYVKKGTEKVITETMLLELVDGQLFYTLKILKESASRKYQLKSYQSTEIVFENSTLTFPNQVVLKPTGSNFTTIYRHHPAKKMDKQLQQYFEQRNQLGSEEAKRVMSKRQ